MEQQKEFGIDKKIKIAWICHFSNEYIQNKLPLWKYGNPYASWIYNTLEGFKNSNEFELHIISPHQFLKKRFTFKDDNIHYHFYPIGIPILHRNWPKFFRFDVITNFLQNRIHIKRYINKIKPNIINFHGAENPEYSSSFLDLYKRYPIIITIQGFISLDFYSKNDYIKKKRVKFEKKIIQKCRFFLLEKDSVSVIKEMRDHDFLGFDFYYPINSSIEKFTDFNKKAIDLLFWGRICEDKGAEDFIYLIANLKHKYPNIKGYLIGSGLVEYIDYLSQKIKEYNCSENIVIKGFIKSSDELYTEVNKCKILIIPTYNDRFPTVLREASFLKIATIAYNTGSIPQFNKNKECVRIVEQGDKVKLIEETEKLIENNELYISLINNAYEQGKIEFSITSNYLRTVNAYKKILVDN